MKKKVVRAGAEQLFTGTVHGVHWCRGLGVGVGTDVGWQCDEGGGGDKVPGRVTVIVLVVRETAWGEETLLSISSENETKTEKTSDKVRERIMIESPE